MELKRFDVRLIPSEKALLDKRRKQFGLSLSNYVAELLRYDNAYHIIEQGRAGKLKGISDE